MLAVTTGGVEGARVVATAVVSVHTVVVVVASVVEVVVSVVVFIEVKRGEEVMLIFVKFSCVRNKDTSVEILGIKLVYLPSSSLTE